MKRAWLVFAVSLLIAGTAANSFSFGGHERKGRTYEITVTNLTRGQIFSPPVVISHNGYFQLFVPGDGASPELATLAEDGITGDLINYMTTLPSVFDYAVASDPLAPGASMTLEVSAHGRFRDISVVGMLVTTNDAFFAVRGVRIPPRGEVIVYGQAYEAGSEMNSEDCDYIPGPPCDSPQVRDPDGAEGYVHIHAGIHGIADLIPARDDWRNPVAEIRIRPIR